MVSWGAWNVGKFAKIKFDNIKKKNPTDCARR
ncbi:DUF5516 domain-containing protein [Neobacillus sp. GCM10027624]